MVGLVINVHRSVKAVLVVQHMGIISNRNHSLDKISGFCGFGGRRKSQRIGSRINEFSLRKLLVFALFVDTCFQSSLSLVQPESEGSSGTCLSGEALRSSELFNNQVVGGVFGVCVFGEESLSKFLVVGISKPSDILNRFTLGELEVEFGGQRCGSLEELEGLDVCVGFG